MVGEPTRRHPVRRTIVVLLGVAALVVVALVLLALPFRGVQDDAEAARDESGGRFAAVSDSQILAAQKELASRDGVFVEPASAAGIAGLLAELAAGESYAGKTVVITVTGHGLKDIATALDGLALPEAVVDADVDAAAAAAGL